MDMQEQRENILIERLKEIIRTSRHAAGEPTWRPQRRCSPVTEEELMQAETQLGFVLPSLLRRIYLEVGNGGLVRDMVCCPWTRSRPTQFTAWSR
jgi:hypothetical protein